MAKGQWLSPHQKGIVRRYYEHKETMATQKLGELVSELYVCEDAAQAGRLWQKVQTALKNAGAPPARADRVVKERDLEGLAELLARLF
jgi:hypothetical protein